MSETTTASIDQQAPTPTPVVESAFHVIVVVKKPSDLGHSSTVIDSLIAKSRKCDVTHLTIIIPNDQYSTQYSDHDLQAISQLEKAAANEYDRYQVLANDVALSPCTKTNNKDGCFSVSTITLVTGYDGRADFVEAVKRLAQSNIKDPLTPEVVGKYTRLGALPEPDLFIFIGKTPNLANAAMWSAAYAEFAFVCSEDSELTEQKFEQIIFDFHGRDRRFGAVATEQSES